MSVLELIRAAGPVLWLIIALSVYVVYILVLHGQTLSRLGKDPTLLLRKVHACIMDYDLGIALRETQGLKSSAANVLRAGLERAPVGAKSAESAMSEAIGYEETRLLGPLNLLSTAAQIGPLLGLLGTVLGMIRSFMVFAGSVDPTPTQLSTGISEALVNTAAGLIVAIVAYLGRSLLRSRAEAILSDVDRVREALPSWLTEAGLRRQGHLSGVPVPIYTPDRVAAQERA
jgi:biopolymer transport protein ExbB